MNNLEMILEVHQYAHHVRRGELERLHDDVHCSEDFLRNLESEDEWRRGEITVHVSLGYDGFPINNTLK